jgi:hypothetical protein
MPLERAGVLDGGSGRLRRGLISPVDRDPLAVAPNFESWLGRFAHDLEPGEYLLSDEYGGLHGCPARIRAVIRKRRPFSIPAA